MDDDDECSFIIARTVKKKSGVVVVVVKMVKMVKISCFHFSCFFVFEYPLGPERANPQCPKNKEKEFGCLNASLVCCVDSPFMY